MDGNWEGRDRDGENGTLHPTASSHPVPKIKSRRLYFLYIGYIGQKDACDTPSKIIEAFKATRVF